VFERRRTAHRHGRGYRSGAGDRGQRQPRRARPARLTILRAAERRSGEAKIADCSLRSAAVPTGPAPRLVAMPPIFVRLPSRRSRMRLARVRQSAALAAGANGALFHFGDAQSNPYLLKIDFNVPSASSVPSATFIFSSNSRLPFRTANAALGLGDADWYVSTTRAHEIAHRFWRRTASRPPV
jgi:hypothetical protein